MHFGSGITWLMITTTETQQTCFLFKLNSFKKYSITFARKSCPLPNDLRRVCCQDTLCLSNPHTVVSIDTHKLARGLVHPVTWYADRYVLSNRTQHGTSLGFKTRETNSSSTLYTTTTNNNNKNMKHNKNTYFLTGKNNKKH